MKDDIGSLSLREMAIKVSDRYDEIRDKMTCWLEHTLDGFQPDMEEIIRSDIAIFHHQIESGTYGKPEYCETCGAVT